MTRPKEDIKKYQQEYRRTHKKQRQEYDQFRYSENKEYFDSKNANYYLEHKEDIQDRCALYYVNNKERIKISHRIYIKNKRKNDVSFNLRSQVSKNINRMLKLQNSHKKGNSILDFLPYTMQELKEYLEQQFEPWMTWNNWGLYNTGWDDNDQSTWTWQLDHIIPQSSLPYSSMTDDNFLKCWALENLRPLSAKQNLTEGNRR